MNEVQFIDSLLYDVRVQGNYTGYWLDGRPIKNIRCDGCHIQLFKYFPGSHTQCVYYAKETVNNLTQYVIRENHITSQKLIYADTGETAYYVDSKRVFDPIVTNNIDHVLSGLDFSV